MYIYNPTAWRSTVRGNERSKNGKRSTIKTGEGARPAVGDFY